ncbi:MAG TPA: acyltransferase [Polyangia bacterium]|nr:acyltransferase [Polyangia bacterium]
MSVSLAPTGQTRGQSELRASQAAYVVYQETKVFGSLDGLRAVAILAVLWHHSARPAPGSILAARGFLGVDLFFVISGFLITTLLLRERQRSGAISLRRFYLRRFLRIFPAYYLTLALVAATVLLKRGGVSSDTVHDLPYAFFYLSNLVTMTSLLSITWSLSTEEQFYLIAPALEKHLGERLPLFLCIALVLVLLPSLGLFPSWHLPAFFRQTTFAPILLGVLLAHTLHEPRGFDWIWRTLRHPLSPVLALGLALAACLYPGGDLMGWPRIAIQTAFMVLVASCVIRERHALRPALRCWPVRRIGIVSYGIYLYHMLVLHFVEKGTQRLAWTSNASSFLMLAFFTWAVAEVSYRLYESRFLALKARFES